MANEKNLRPFKKGQSGNPEGARAHKRNKELKALRDLSNEQIKEVGAVVLKGNLQDLSSIKDDPTASVLKVWFASVAVKAIGKGDVTALGMLLDRICGKVVDKIHHSGTPQTMVQQGTVLILPEKEIHVENITAAGTSNQVSVDDS